MPQPKKSVKPEGEIRRSQLTTTFGSGSMVDLPDRSVLIGGLNVWKGHKDEPIEETRLANKVRSYLQNCGHIDNGTQISLYAPPACNDADDAQVGFGIQTFLFPLWFVAQKPEIFQRGNREYQSRPLVKYQQLSKWKYEDRDRKKYSVVPVRFVQGCSNGHLSDIDWLWFVHKGENTCRGTLRLDEGGTGNDFSQIFVRCPRCQAERPLSDATVREVANLGFCQGNMPWLGFNHREECHQPDSDKPERNRLLVRSASTAYFSQTLSAISIPDSDQKLKDAVNQVYESYLEDATEVEDIAYFRRKQKNVRTALENLSDVEVFAEVKRRRSGKIDDGGRPLKQVELETLLATREGEKSGSDETDSNFYAERRSLPDPLPNILSDRLDRIVLVHRLREVIAQVGFTRFEAINTNIDGEFPTEDMANLNVRVAKLAEDMTWVPTIENKGEGIFISFQPEAIAAWSQRAAVKQRDRLLRKGYQAWCDRQHVKDPEFNHYPGVVYIMLHTLSHLLVTEVALACGYSASAIKERIYVGDHGNGILLHTGSTGSEGTLGGLIEVGQTIEQHLQGAIERGKLCSNDPLCSQHQPDNFQSERFRHGAACHGCVLIAETSCEQRNEFLDRALVIATVEDHIADECAAFFG